VKKFCAERVKIIVAAYSDVAARQWLGDGRGGTQAHNPARRQSSLAWSHVARWHRVRCRRRRLCSSSDEQDAASLDV